MNGQERTEKIALIDMDGTLADYDGAMRMHLAKISRGMDEIPENLYNDPPAWLKERTRMIKNLPGFWRNLNPISLGMEVYRILGEMGYRRMILTKGPRRTTAAWTEKVEWCAEHVPEADITVTHDKGLVYGKLLFDDYPPYIERWLEWRPRGYVIMPDSFYNQEFDHPRVFRLSSTSELPDLVDHIETIVSP